jgi:hypothetical protein
MFAWILGEEAIEIHGFCIEFVAAGDDCFFAHARQGMRGERDNWDVPRLRIGLETPRCLPALA